MKFSAKSISFRIAQLPRPLPPDAIEQFAAHAAAPIEAMGADEKPGWVLASDLLSTAIENASAIRGECIHLALRMAKRKIPASLLAAEVRREQAAHMAAANKAFISSRERAEIRQSVLERLLPKTPPTIYSIPFIYKPGTCTIFVGATTDRQMDVFNLALVQTFNVFAEPISPINLATLLKNVKIDALPTPSFSPSSAAFANPDPGGEFLTWLWFSAEAANGCIVLPNHNRAYVLVDGPMAFRRDDGAGALSAVLSNGVPVNSAEAKTCLVADKKLVKAKISMILPPLEEPWTFTLDASDFSFRGMRMPKSDSLDPAERFDFRISMLENFKTLFFDVYGTYLELRSDSDAWNLAVALIKHWIEEKKARA
jgi:hypothetical protein